MPDPPSKQRLPTELIHEIIHLSLQQEYDNIPHHELSEIRIDRRRCVTKTVSTDVENYMRHALALALVCKSCLRCVLQGLAKYGTHLWEEFPWGPSGQVTWKKVETSRTVAERLAEIGGGDSGLRYWSLMAPARSLDTAQTSEPLGNR
ncbi:MAG: hypothetical protein Q9159_006435 [Coniocarpon cinnabarinum]